MKKYARQSCNDSTKSVILESNDSQDSPKGQQLDELNSRLSQMILKNQELEKRVIVSQQEVDES